MEAIAQTQAQAQATTQQKVPEIQKQVVTRILGFKETANGKRRIGTIYYEYNRQTKTIKYGASIFRTDAKKPEHFVRADHIQTATNRFNKHPITVTNFPDNTTLQDFNQRIRELLFRYGCRSK